MAGAVAHQAGCRQKCSKKQHKAQTRCRHRRISRTETGPGVSVHSSAKPPHPESDQPPLLLGELQSWDLGTEERPGDRTATTLPDRTRHSLRAEKRKNVNMMRAHRICTVAADNYLTYQNVMKKKSYGCIHRFSQKLKLKQTEAKLNLIQFRQFQILFICIVDVKY